VTQLRKKMLEEIQHRNYSHGTARTYVRIVRDFAEYFHQPRTNSGPSKFGSIRLICSKPRSWLRPQSVSMCLRYASYL
jgi:integrase/recombinase XerD